MAICCHVSILIMPPILQPSYNTQLLLLACQAVKGITFVIPGHGKLRVYLYGFIKGLYCFLRSTHVIKVSLCDSSSFQMGSLKSNFPNFR